MLRKLATRIVIILISSTLVVGLLLSFISCEHATPTCPNGETENRELIGQSEGTIGDGSVSTQQKLYKDLDGEEITNEMAFYDNSNHLIGNAVLTAAEDLVKQINMQIADLGKNNTVSDIADAELTAAQDLAKRTSLQIADIPSEIFIELGEFFVLKIVVTSYPLDPTKYQIDLTNMSTGEFLSFLLSKVSFTNVDPTQFIGFVATHAVLLCLGAQETVDDSQVCRENAPVFCGAVGFKRAYIEARFSIANGCESSCKIVCNVHDQGGIGF